MATGSSSVQVIARFNAGQLSPLLMHVGKWPAARLAIKRSADVAPEVDLGECTLHLPMQRQKSQNPLWF